MTRSPGSLGFGSLHARALRVQRGRLSAPASPRALRGVPGPGTTPLGGVGGEECPMEAEWGSRSSPRPARGVRSAEEPLGLRTLLLPQLQPRARGAESGGGNKEAGPPEGSAGWASGVAPRRGRPHAALPGLSRSLRQRPWLPALHPNSGASMSVRARTPAPSQRPGSLSRAASPSPRASPLCQRGSPTPPLSRGVRRRGPGEKRAREREGGAPPGSGPTPHKFSPGSETPGRSRGLSRRRLPSPGGGSRRGQREAWEGPRRGRGAGVRGAVPL